MCGESYDVPAYEIPYCVKLKSIKVTKSKYEKNVIGDKDDVEDTVWGFCFQTSDQRDN